MLVGVSVSAGIFSAVEAFSENPSFPVRIFAQLLSKKAVKKEVSAEAPNLAPVIDDITHVAIPAQGKAIRVDLENGTIALYEDGQFFKDFRAVAVPDEFSPWRVPQGAYAIKALEAKHYSPLAEASFPDAVLFSDNGLIRAERDAEQTQNNRRTDAKNKTETSLNKQSAAAGLAAPEHNAAAGIALTKEDAAELFNFADTATEVIGLN